MYNDHFGFREKPFNLVPNPSYLFLSSRHANALTFLEYGLAEKVGFVMLTGEIGIGKTTLVRHLLNQIESEMDVAVIFNTNVLSDDLIRLILAEFEVPVENGISKAKALEALYEFLIQRYSQGRNVLLIIDEAQNLTPEVLEEIRMLSNLQTDQDMLLQIMIVGQPELRDKIRDPKMEQFAQRIAVSYHLAAMTQDETREYIAHRIEKAGGRSSLFSGEAVEKIFEASGGIPRTINLLCDAALVYGYADELQEIGTDTLAQVIEDKGGMGVFTRAGSAGKQEPGPAPGERNRETELMERVQRIETEFSQLKMLYRSCLKEMETRAEACRDLMMEDLKQALARERKKNEKLAFEYGKIRERYAQLIEKIKMAPKVDKW